MVKNDSIKILLLENKDFTESDNLLNFKNLKPSRFELRMLSEEVLAKSIEEIAREIFEKHTNTELFIINVNVLLSDGNRSDCLGIKLLKFIRLYGLNQHCMLYSFLSREQLMQLSPYHCIIFSEGTSFVRLPNDLSKLNFQKRVEKKAPEDLSPYFKAEYQLPDNRHFMANWWGMLQLWNVQKAIEHNASKTKWQDIEKRFTGSIKEMYSYQGLLARYLNNHKVDDIEHELTKLLHEREEKYSDITISSNEIAVEIQHISDTIIEIDREFDVLNAVNIVDETLLKRIITCLFKNNTVGQNVQNKIFELIEEKQSLEQIKAHFSESQEISGLIDKENYRIYEERRKQNNRLLSLQSHLEHELHFSTENFSLAKIRDDLQIAKPKIVYVDDQANEGWSSILQRMIYGHDSDSFILVVPKQNDSIYTIVTKINDSIKDAKLLILDIRLKNETGQIEPSQLSGFQVLRKLKEYFIPCPVLIISASNKIWSVKEAFSYSAVAFWTKEGLDAQMDAKDSIANYLRLMDLIYSLTANYQFFKIVADINKTINTIECGKNKFWWEEKFWPDKYTFIDIDSNKQVPRIVKINKSSIERENVTTILHHVVELIEDKLFQTFLNGNLFVPESFFSVIISRCSLIMEEIHRINNNNDKTPLSEKMESQIGEENYEYYSALIKIRNKSVHRFESIPFITFNKYIDLLQSYLFDDFESTKLEQYEMQSSSELEEVDTIKERLPDPVDGNFYEAKVNNKNEKISQNQGFDAYHLENPGINLQQGRDIILLFKENPELQVEKDLIGKMVRFRLVIRGGEDGKPISYLARNAKLIDDHQTKTNI
jgi:CheY-like chemotaxis protein